MSSLFRSKPASSTTTTQMDPTQRAILTDAYGQVQAATSRPYQAYDGRTVAGLNNYQQTGLDTAFRGAQNNVGGGALTNAMGMTQQAANYQPMTVGAQQVRAGTTQADQVQGSQFAGTDMSQYMNPYTDIVAQGMMDNMGRQLAKTQMDNSAAATAAGAYGGSRHGVVEGETNRAYFDTLGQNLGQLYSQGYTQAAGLASQDADRRQQATLANQGANLQAGLANQNASLQAQQANQGASLQASLANQNAQYQKANLGLSAGAQMAGLSDQQRNQYFQNAAVMQGAGDKMQAQNQAELSDAYNRWLEQQNYPLSMATMRMNAANGMPMMGQSSSGTTGGGGGSTMSNIGQGLGIAGMAMGLFSDKNLKSGRKPVSDEKALKAVKKMPMETWHYDPAKGGPDDGGVTHIGPMAQTVKKNLGIGNGSTIPVVDAMGANFAATKALAKKVDKLAARKPMKSKQPRRVAKKEA